MFHVSRTYIKSKPAIRRYEQVARAQSAEATARRIVDAFLAALVSQWYDEITLDRVAADADVTVQTVVRRFGGKEGLLSAAFRALGAQINAQRADPAGDVDRFADSVVEDYERTGDMVLRFLALELRHPRLKEFVDIGRAEHRRWTAQALAGPLSRVDEPMRTRALDALVVAGDVFTWKILRRDMGRGVAESKATIGTMVRATLSGFTKARTKERR